MSLDDEFKQSARVNDANELRRLRRRYGKAVGFIRDLRAWAQDRRNVSGWRLRDQLDAFLTQDSTPDPPRVVKT